MGLAILWIFVFHSKVFFPGTFIFHPLRLVVSTGYGGVDIFFFLSGFGLMHHMLIHNSTCISFYKKRLLNILPSYLLATIIALSIDYIAYDNVSFKKIVLCLTTIGFWTDNYMFYWFIPSILSLYFIYPIFYKYYIKYKIYLIFIIIIFSIIACILLTTTNNDHFIRLISRIPIFFIGSHVKYISNNRNKLTRKEIYIQLSALLLAFGLLLGLMILPHNFNIKDYGLAYFAFTIGTLPLCLFTSVILDKLSQVSKINNLSLLLLLSVCGSVSLEMYLVHKQIVFKVGEIILPTVPTLSIQSLLINYGHYLEYIVYFIITLLLALQLNRFSSYIRTHINRPSGNMPQLGNPET